MVKEVLIFGILFFASLTLFNVFLAIKRKESFAPAIVGFFMMLMALFFYFDKFLYGFMSFAVSVIVAVVKYNEASKTLERQFKQEIEKTDITEPLKIRDFLTWKGWVKIAMRKGAEKAALVYALFLAAVAVIVWLLLINLFPPEFEESFGARIYLYAGVFTVVFFFYYRRAFEKALKKNIPP
ncbi:MAG: hypothetical protein OIN66_03550 [Candidatus Methanoperedens sp.]|nr:hypothetical protein [Candidatus Methanoperedens sp.]